MVTADIRGKFGVGVAFVENSSFYPGLAIADNKPLTGNVTDEMVLFNSGATLREYVGNEVLLVFELQDSVLYTVTV